MSGHIPDLYWDLLLNVDPFANMQRGNFWGPFSLKGAFFHKKKMLFLVNINCCLKFLEYALNVLKTLYNF